MKRVKNRHITPRLLAAVVAIAALAFVMSGCTTSKPMSSEMKAKPKAENTAPISTASAESSMTSGKAMPKPDPNKQMCATCSLKKMPVPTNGTVESVEGKQIIKVSIKDGTYLPNRFVAEAGKPVTVVFTVEGKPVIGCLSKPTFSGDKLHRAALKKSLTVTSGTKSVDLGSLAVGTYEFSCGMGMNVSKIIVQ